MDLSRSPTISKVKGQEITLTNEERHIYSQLFQAADEDKKGVVTGQSAVNFFGKSGLEPSVLSKIWQMADTEQKGFLTKQTFSIALKLIAKVQNGQLPDTSDINADVPLPRFEGINVEPYQKPGQEINNTILNITNEDREKHKATFYKLNPVNGIVDGGKAKDLFVKSKLPVEKLSQIWVLADTKNRGQLDLPEFIIAMHFITQTLKGAIVTPPTELPSGLYEMAAGAKSGSATPPFFAGNLSSPKSGQSPVTNTKHMTLDSGITTPSIFQDNSWDVTEKDKATYDRLFDTVDKNRKGYLTGDEAVNFFTKSKLTPDQLAQIWDLAAINKSDRLNRDEFAVAMYLIAKKIAGVPLPTSLPNSLIPPSMRSVAVSDLKRSATIGSRSHNSSAQLSESDLFFDSLHNATSSSPFFPSTTSQTGSEFDLLGDTDINTKIALESSEIKSYKSQSENLNNATTDLKNNRANVESDISSLVTQKQDMMVQLSQIRTLYESETKSLREVQAKYDLEHESVEKVRQELLQADKALRALQLERDQLQANIQKDRDETHDIKKRMRIAEEETVSIKAEIEKLKKEGRQVKGFLAINRKQLAAVEGEKEKAFKTLQAFENKESPSQGVDVNDPFGTGAFTPLAFNSQSTTDFNESGNLQKSIHSHHGSFSSISEFGIKKRSMSNASIASNSTLGTSSIKSAPLSTNKTDEPSFDKPSFDKPITVASSKPSEFENILSDQFSSSLQQEVTTNAAESNKVVNSFESTSNDPFGTNNGQTNKSTQNNEESTKQQETVKESEKSEDNPFSNLNNVPISGKSGFDSAFDSAFDAPSNDNLSSDSFTKEFPSIEEFDSDFTTSTTNPTVEENPVTNAPNLGFTNNMESNSSIKKSENAFSTETTKNDDKDINNAFNKESESTFSIVADPTESADAWVSIESSTTKSIVPQDDFAFGDLTEAKVTKTPPIEFDAGFDDADFDETVNFTFDAPTTPAKLPSNSNNTVASSAANFAKSSIDFGKGFDDFDPFSPSTSSSSNKPTNLDAAFGSISAEPSNIGFDNDFFAEFPSSSKTDKQSTTTTSIKTSTSQPQINSVADDDDIEDVKKLLGLGYPRDKAVKALELNDYNFEKSLYYLMDNSS